MFIFALYYPFKLADKKYRKPYGNVSRWIQTCAAQPEFQAVVGNDYHVQQSNCCERWKSSGGKKKKEKKAAAPKKEAPKKEKPKGLKEIMRDLPNTMVLDVWKKYIPIPKTASVMQQFYDMYDNAGWTICM